MHPHIVRVFDLVEDAANFYIVMELMKGGDLFANLARRNKNGLS